MSTELIDNLDRARRFLSDLHDRTGSVAVIAGGFCRDQFLGAPYRDIDLYVNIEDWQEFSECVFADYGQPSYNEGHQFLDSDSAEYRHQYIQKRREGPARHWIKDLMQRDFDIDLIGIAEHAWVQGPEYIVDRFNLSLSQAWLDAEGLQYTDQFVQSFSVGQNRILRTDWGHDKTMAAIEKFKLKYPGWYVTLPDGSEYNKDTFIQHSRYLEDLLT